MSRDPSLPARTTSGASHGRALLLALLSGLLALSFGAGIAAANPPPGQSTLFFSPSASGGCGDGQISGIGESSAPGQPSASPITMSPSNSPFFQPPGGYDTASGLYAGGMAATPWGTGFGGIMFEQLSSQVYFTNTCSGSSQQLLAACYSASGYGSVGSAGQLTVCGSGEQYGTPLPWPVWIAWQAPAGQSVGRGVAIDATRNLLYFATMSGCTGGTTCQTVNLWVAGTAGSWGDTLTPTLVGQLSGNWSADYLAVDPVTRRLFLLGTNSREVISVPAAGGGSQSVLISGGSLVSGTVTGIGVDPSTSMVYVLSAQQGSEPNQIAQVPETGCCATSLFSGGAVGNSSESIGLAVDPANGVAVWANSPAGSSPKGLANTISWGPLDATGATTYGWTGAPNASYAAYVQALTIAGGLGTCQGADNGGTYNYPCPATSVAAAGTTATASSSGSVVIPLTADVVGGTGPGATSRASMQVDARQVTGPMTVTVRDRRRAGRSARTYATLRPGFSVAPNTRVVRRVTLPATALPSLRRGDLEVQVRTRPAGTGQRWRTRVLRVVRR